MKSKMFSFSRLFRNPATLRTSTRQQALRRRPMMDALEGRQLLSTFTVSNTNDSGPGSLRAAILASDANPPVVQVSGGLGGGAAQAPVNVIQFNLQGSSTIISPLSQLPTITQPTWFSGSATLNGSQAGAGAVGLDFQVGASRITDLVIEDFGGGGVLFDGAAASDNLVLSDTISSNGAFGIEARNGASDNEIEQTQIVDNNGGGAVFTGAGTSGNTVFLDTIEANASGVVIEQGASNNLVELNTISGNAFYGVALTGTGTSGNTIESNEIGTNAAGTAALPNGYGVSIFSGASNNTISGDVISGNTNFGVEISGSGTTGNVVSGDFIGTNAAGTAAIANAQNGIQIDSGASSNTIGGTTASARDIISGNTYNGVVIVGSGTSYNDVEGDYIGTNAAGNAAVGNGLRGVLVLGGATENDIGTTQSGGGDLISGNVGYGVYLSDAGTSLNWVEGDLIGTNAADNAALPNTFGVTITSGATSNGVLDDVISGNEFGVYITGAGTSNNFVYFNEIGTNASGTQAIGNTDCGVYVYDASNNDVLYNTIEYSGVYGVLNFGATNEYAYNTVLYSGYQNVVMD